MINFHLQLSFFCTVPNQLLDVPKKRIELITPFITDILTHFNGLISYWNALSLTAIDKEYRSLNTNFVDLSSGSVCKPVNFTIGFSPSFSLPMFLPLSLSLILFLSQDLSPNVSLPVFFFIFFSVFWMHLVCKCAHINDTSCKAYKSWYVKVYYSAT